MVTYGSRIVSGPFSCPQLEHVFSPALYNVEHWWQMYRTRRRGFLQTRGRGSGGGSASPG